MIVGIIQNDRIRWWPIYHDDQECVGKIQLSIGSTITSDETNHIKVSFYHPNSTGKNFYSKSWFQISDFIFLFKLRVVWQCLYDLKLIE